MNNVLVNEASELFERLKHSDEKAFENLFKMYFKKVLYFLVTVVKDKDTASDLAQDLFMKLWESRETLVIAGNVDTYLYVMAKNRGIDFLRKKRTEEEYMGDPSQLPSIHFNPEASYAARDTLEHIDRIIEEMPEQRKQIFLLSRKQGFSYKEIAVRLNIKPKTVESHIYSAIKQISGGVERAQ